jgi:DNA-binding NtrC family response regulator
MKPILIVDDEAIVRDSISDWLKDSGYETETAETGEEALDLIAKKDFSVAIIDVRLPGKSGIAVLKEIRAVKPGIKTIVITAYPSESAAEEVKKLGAADYLIKPFSPGSLDKIILDTLKDYNKKYGDRPAS